MTGLCLLCAVAAAWDFINHEEVNAAKFMAAKGYKTAHFGKWHNGEATGYQPWSVGFQDSWYTPNKLSDGLMINNGEYVQSKGYTEEVTGLKSDRVACQLLAACSCYGARLGQHTTDLMCTCALRICEWAHVIQGLYSCILELL